MHGEELTKHIMNCNHLTVMNHFNMLIAEIDREDYKTVAEVRASIVESMDIMNKIHKGEGNG